MKKTILLLAVAGLVLALAPAAQAQPIVTPGDGYTGDYRIAFVTSNHDIMATFDRTMADYNADVTTAAGLVTELNDLSTTWTAIASTPTVDARDNTGTNPNTDGTGVPIYTTSGLRIADDNADLWDASIQNPILADDGTTVNEGGGHNAYDDYAWTGTNHDGTGASSGDGNELSSGDGVNPKNIRVVRGGYIDKNWIDGVSINDLDPRGARIMGMSGVIVPGPPQLVWRDATEDDWTSINWTPDSGATFIAPAGGEIMVVNSGIATISTDLTVLDPADSLSVARDAEGGTVEIASGGTLAVGEVTVAAGGTLNVSGSLSAGSLGVAVGGALGLGDGGMVTSPLAAPELSDVTITIEGALNSGDGVALVGDEENDLSSTNLTLADGATMNWTFSSGDDYVDVFGEVTIAGALEIQLVDGGGVANNEDVALFRAVDVGAIDSSLITVLSPAGETWTWATDGNGDPVLSFGGEYLVLEGLVTGAAAVPGDANGDQIVNDADLALFEAQFGGTPGGADFDGDGDVDLDDFATMRGNWGFGTGGAPAAGAATPEPATMSLLALGGLAVLRRRRS